MAEKCEHGNNAAPDERAREYHRLRISLCALEVVLEVLFIVLLLFTGASIRIREYVEQRMQSPFHVVEGYLILVLLIYQAMFLPLRFYRDFKVEHRFGLSTQALMQWGKDYAKAALVEFLFAFGLIEIMYSLMTRYPERWWVIFAGIVIIIFVLVQKWYPALVLSLFYKAKPLADEALAKRLSDLARTAGVSVRGVYEFNLSRKTRAANALLAGLGGSRRVLLADTLLRNFPPDEIEAVTAHEFGHHVHRHLMKGLFVQAMLIVAVLYVSKIVLKHGIGYFGFRGIADVANLPLIGLVFAVAGIVAMPLVNALLRRFERAADAYACRTASQPRAFVSALKRFAALNLIDPHVHPVIEFIFYGHPSIQKRIASCEKLCEQITSTVETTAPDAT